MSTVLHLTVNMKFCIRLAVYKCLRVTDDSTWLPSSHQHWLWSLARVSRQQLQPIWREQSLASRGHQLPTPVLLSISLTGHLERVNLFPLLGQRLVHAAQVVAHHAQLILVAPLGGGQLILQPADVLTGQPHLLCQRLLRLLRQG